MPLHDDLADEVVGLFVDVQRFEGALRERVFGLLHDLERDLVAKIRDLGDDGRLGRFLAQARASIFSVYDRGGQLIGRELRDLAEFSSDALVAGLNSAAGAKLLTTALTRADLKTLASDVLVRGRKIGPWLKKQSTDTAFRFESAMRLGAAQGETVDELIERVRGRPTGARQTIRGQDGRPRKVRHYTGGVLNGTSRREAESLARTAVQTISNDVMRRTFEENDDVIAGVVTIATLDRRTTELCISRDGASWNLETGQPMEGSPRDEPFPGYPPWHWRCRSVLGPITRSWEGLAERAGGKVPRRFQERIPESVRASMGGPVPGDKTYHEWLKGKPETFQKDILGPSRYRLWKDGKITAHQLTDASGRSLSVDELRQRRNLVKRVPKG